ncbi:MAG: biliverdin-producing heme oxygenase [Campylobacterales bacterium]
MDEFHRELKEQTREFHDELEKSTLPKKLFNQTISKDEYITYLYKMYIVHYAVENALNKFSWQEFGIDIQEYLRLPLLQKDLLFLDKDGFVQPNVQILDIKTLDDAIGYLYVLTGSTMGGKILSQKATLLFGKANCYFEAFGEDTLNRWEQFLIRLSAYVQKKDQNSRRKIVLSAEECYKFVQATLNE